MQLLILCEPLFQYVARARRSAAKGCELPIEKVRADIQRLFEEMRQQASGTPALADQYEKVRLPLVFFVDFMMRESDLSFRTEWVPLAYDIKEFAGDEKFFDMLEAELKDSGDKGAERLAVYHTCLGLGFTGVYMGQPDAIRRLMGRISGRISRLMDGDRQTRICPQAYEHTDTRDFTEPPNTKLVSIGIGLVGLLIVWFVGYWLFFSSQSGDINRSLDKIIPVSGSPTSSSASHVSQPSAF
jgi:type VI secretion system protein ImpK